MTVQDFVESAIETRRDQLIDISDQIWDLVETRFAEYQSAELICQALEKEGFAVERGLAGLPTAFMASFGSGEPVIAFLGEYDALPGLSQAAGTTEKTPLSEGQPGHGCGHHALGVGSLAAAAAVKDHLLQNRIPGTLRYYGCPAEEGGSGKMIMARAGCFNGVSAGLTWHPGTENLIWSHNFLANIQSLFKFTGISAHAAGAPHLGRSALDAVELMNVGVNFLREHVIPDARLHYAITDAGGIAPNVVQPKAAVLQKIRAPRMSQVREIYQRVIDIARGAALMTGTTLTVEFDAGTSNLLPNRTLELLMHEQFSQLGPAPVNDGDIAKANAIRATFSENEKKNNEEAMGALYGEPGRKLARSLTGKAIVEALYPYWPVETPAFGSSDVGDASWNMPVAVTWVTCYANGTPGHSWQEVAQGKSDLCHKGLLHAGKVMAMTAIELYTNPELLARVKAEFDERIDEEAYVSPLS